MFSEETNEILRQGFLRIKKYFDERPSQPYWCDGCKKVDLNIKENADKAFMGISSFKIFCESCHNIKEQQYQNFAEGKLK